MNLYVISEGPEGPVKIGVSQNASSRVSGLQTGNPRRLSIAAYWSLSREEALESERKLADELAEFSLVGEWFSIGEELALFYVPNFFLAEGIEAERVL